MGLPDDGAVDSSLALLREGYLFVPERCRQLESDAFRTRLMLQPAVCMSGAAAAAQFYRPGRFTRKGAMPPTVLHLLQDKGSVQTLDRKGHLHRKRLFLGLLSGRSTGELVRCVEQRLAAAADSWAQRDEVVLHDELKLVLCDCAHSWAGLPLEPREVPKRARELGEMIAGAGSVGPRNLRAQLLRRRAERRLERTVRAVRHGWQDLPGGSPAKEIVWHRDDDGELLPERLAAVELLNILRPTVAIARFLVFAAHALHQYPQWREELTGGGAEIESSFVQEVRRFYPFFPVIAGRVVQEFEWRGHLFAPGLRVLLDLFGTNRDAACWDVPHEFRPDRFVGRRVGPFELAAQGAGEVERGHRCPGEELTIALMRAGLRFLVSRVGYRVPKQDLKIDLTRMPALPRSGFVMSDVVPLL